MPGRTASARLALLAIAANLGGCGPAQRVPDTAEILSGDLEPMPSALTCHTPDYPLHLRQVLLERAPKACDLQFLAMPSFEPERLLTVHQVGGQYAAQVLIPERQVWAFASNVAEIQCQKVEKPLPKPLAERACRVWTSMLRRTRHNESPFLLPDGISYAFLRDQPGSGTWTGQSSNPQPGTRPQVLADIGDHLIAFVRADAADESHLLAQVAKALDRLEASLGGK
jgi:hypothetical protein